MQSLVKTRCYMIFKSIEPRVLSAFYLSSYGQSGKEVLTTMMTLIAIQMPNTAPIPPSFCPPRSVPDSSIHKKLALVRSEIAHQAISSLPFSQ